MARSVFVGIASATLGLAFTAALAIPAMAMAPSDYKAEPLLGTTAKVETVISNRARAADYRRMREEDTLRDIRAQRVGPPVSFDQPVKSTQQPFSLTLPF